MTGGWREVAFWLAVSGVFAALLLILTGGLK